MSQYDWRALERSARQPQWIRTDAELAEHASYWRSLPLVALDTEFQRVDTFYPIPGLIQLADDRHCYLIDPLTIQDFSPFAMLLEDCKVLKVLHASTEDLELFFNSYGARPEPLFDTQVAAAFVGWGSSMGLRRMLEQELEVELAKEETTSNWLQRPLTEAQEHYAALDVAYLPEIAARQRKMLAELGRSGWVHQECAALLDTVIDIDPDGHDYYKRFSQMYRRRPKQIAALRDLSAWREQISRRDNIPRSRVLRNQALLELVDKWPRNRGQLSRLSEMRGRTLRSYGDQIMAILEQAEQSAKDHPPEPIPKPLHVHWAPHMKAVKAAVRKLAEQWGVPPEVLLRKKELEALIRSADGAGNYQLPDEMTHWRRDEVGPLLLDALAALEN
ncbi:MAG: ribonuclease D [Marinobacterium sp.]|nr:ribonuclease D [Marinobacterium sp.]